MVAACAKSPDGQSASIRSASQVVLTEPPDSSDYSGPTATPVWALTNDGVEFQAVDGPKITLMLQNQAQAMAVLPWHIDGPITHYLIGFIDAAEKWSLFRFHDADGDTVPDESTKTLLFDSGTAPAYITYIARAPDSDTIYLLDRRCQDVWVAKDSDSDGFPEDLQSTPFAQSATYPALLDGRMLVVPEGGTVDVPSNAFLVGYDDHPAYFDFMFDIYRLEDTDANGVADTLSTWRHASSAPTLYGRPYDGQTVLKIAGTEGSLVEFWKVAELDDSPITLLGSVTLGAGDWTTMTLASGLSEDDSVRLNYSGTPDDGIVMRVWKDLPQMVNISGRVLDIAGGSIDLNGVNLHSNVVVRLRTGFDLSSVHMLSIVVHDSESATVTVPTLPSTAVGTAMLEMYDPAHPVLDGLTGTSVSVCESD
jgi:hypothetical protein